MTFTATIVEAEYGCFPCHQCDAAKAPTHFFLAHHCRHLPPEPLAFALNAPRK